MTTILPRPAQPMRQPDHSAAAPKRARRPTLEVGSGGTTEQRGAHHRRGSARHNTSTPRNGDVTPAVGVRRATPAFPRRTRGGSTAPCSCTTGRWTSISRFIRRGSSPSSAPDTAPDSGICGLREISDLLLEVKASTRHAAPSRLSASSCWSPAPSPGSQLRARCRVIWSYAMV